MLTIVQVDATEYTNKYDTRATEEIIEPSVPGYGCCLTYNPSIYKVKTSCSSCLRGEKALTKFTKHQPTAAIF